MLTAAELIGLADQVRKLADDSLSPRTLQDRPAMLVVEGLYRATASVVGALERAAEAQNDRMLVLEDLVEHYRAEAGEKGGGDGD